MDLLQGIRMRRSIRAFKDRSVDKSALEKVILAASNAPSYSNTQPWEVAVVTGKKREELIRNLYQAAQLKKRARPHFPFPRMWPEKMRKRSFIHMKKRLETVGIRGNNPDAKKRQFLRNFLFFDAPVIIVVYMDGCLESWSTFDLGLFVQNLVLSAHGMGLATCIQAMPVAYPEIIAKCLGICSNKRIVVTVALGYKDESAPINRYRSEKKPIEEWVKWF